MSININQFGQATVQGALDLNITKSGIFQGQVSANQASALSPGQAVKFDTSSGVIPQVVSAAIGDIAIGFLVFDTQKAAPVAGDRVQIAYFGGPCMWMTAGGTIAAGAAVENKSDGTVQTKSAQATRGYALDPATSGNLLRVLITNNGNLTA